MEIQEVGEYITQVAKETQAELDTELWVAVRIMHRTDTPAHPGVAFMGLFATEGDAKENMAIRSERELQWTKRGVGYRTESTPYAIQLAADGRYDLYYIVQEVKRHNAAVRERKL